MLRHEPRGSREGSGLAGKPLEDLLRNPNSVPEAVRTAVQKRRWAIEPLAVLATMGPNAAARRRETRGRSTAFGDFEKFKEVQRRRWPLRPMVWLVNEGGKLDHEH